MNLKRTLCALILVVSLASYCSSQIATGVLPFNSYGGGPFDAVNLGNLNVHFTIPVLHKAGRGTPFTYDLNYDSSVYRTVVSNGTTTWAPVTTIGNIVSYWGWQGLGPVYSPYVAYKITSASGMCGQQNNQPWSSNTYSNAIYYDTTGTAHSLNAGGTYYNSPGPPNCPPSGPQPSGTTTVTAQDGSGVSAIFSIGQTSMSGNIQTKDGTIINVPWLTSPPTGSSPYATTDRNGNIVSFSISNGTYTDTLGQAVLVAAGTAPNPVTFSYIPPANKSTGTRVSVTVNFVNYTVQTNFNAKDSGGHAIAEYRSTSAVALVDHVTLPDGSQYRFQYEATPSTPSSGACTPISGTTCTTGRISSVTLPTGGTISYTYTGGVSGANGIFNDGSAAALTRTVSPGGQWTYARNQVSGNHWQTTVTSPAGDNSVLDFIEDSASSTPTYSFYATQRQFYQGSVSPSNLLSTTFMCYNNNYANCTTSAVTSPITQTDVYSQLQNGNTRLSETLYNGSSSGSGLVSDDKEYDYGVGMGSSPGTAHLIREIATTYASLGNGIIDRPATVVVYDWTSGISKTVASATYTYDGSTPTAPPGTTPQHTSITGSRGNLTTIATQANSNTTLYQNFTYYDTGNLKSATDAGLTSSGGPNITTYNYPDATSTCGNAFATTVTLPIVGTTPSMTFDCIGAVATQTKDMNGNTTNIAYTDPAYWRSATSTDPLSNVTNFAYTPTSFEQWITFGSSIAESFTMTDSLGRSFLSQRQQNTWPSNFDTVSRTYDSVGRIASVSMPCSTTWKSGCPSSPATSITYDALNRSLTSTDGGGGVTGYSYNENDVLVTVGPNPNGEHTKQRQYEYDGLGRLTSVCEITNVAGSGTCGQANTSGLNFATGYVTKYAYDVLGNLTGVTQNAQGSPTQTRSYSYDMLSRLTSETNPETGTTSYIYDSGSGVSCAPNSAGDLLKKTDANGNWICYTYDALHRLTDVGNSSQSAANPCKRFRYDNTSGILGTRPTGVTVTNSLSRLAEAETDNCTWPVIQTSMITDEWFSYSARGELTDLYESTPHSAGYYHVSTGYFANGALQALNNIGNGFNYGFGVDGEGRLKSAALTNSTLTNYVSNVTYNPASQPLTISYASGDSDIYTYDTNTGRASTYTFTVGSTPKSMVGTLTWNPNGTLSKLAVTDAFNASGTQTCKYGDPSASVAGYDDLSRLVSANCGSVWSQAFSYDPFGNITKSGTSAWMPGYNQSNNRYTLGGTTYDADGNLLTDTFHTYTWNVYGRPATIDGTTTLTYDATGVLVEKGVSGAYTEFEYGPTGKTCTMNGTAQVQCITPLPGGSALARGPETIWHPDWLGSVRLGSSPSNRTITFDRAFAPFGEAYNTITGGTTNLAFTGLTQDSVSGEYDTPNRLLHPGQSRWISPDPAGLEAAEPTNPQSWNRYTYVVNNPLALIDPTGMDFCGGNSSYTTGGGGTSNLPDPKCIPDGINPYYQADYNTQTQPVPDWHYMQNQTWQSVDAWLYSGAKDKNGNPYGIVDYTPLPGAGPINGFAPGTVGPGDLGKIGAQEGAIPGWYFDEVETGWSRLLFLDMGYPIHMSEPTKTINGVKTTFVNEWTDWRDFFNDVGIDYKGPGFPSTAPPASIVVHPSKCGALSQAVTQFTNSGQIPPPGLVQAMKKACGS